ncbi:MULTISPECIES: SpoIIE family protein phosphatase [Thermomonospora]|uniref:Putative PAS/PAC sensor protein n=1 Tax=Thermomonospora curvata (strain ATCC 19995 / DSM 43183 / JCM 3096 / KCTC 9072 / NBRC 15933 / NCIMB 10081 / Henssen B9) TaxID=471852 RepID=D1A6H9_THECD|nr:MULTISPECIES: SpoIIE family protein phosphatase [Thermomonospora]ACY96454.1 putative PAS/PAC sensor protein [Thermomonospora curvata DSM 43183]PKK15851.1 MAG: PAS sensor protein [Thermomonospora sp. CIF 1]
MPEQLEPGVLMREISDLEERIGELRQAAAMPDPDLRATLEAALVELELALAALRTLGTGQSAGDGRISAAESERRVLRTVFQDAPVPLFLLDRDGSVRRVNRQAATLLGTSPGYVSGKPFSVFCDLPGRAALRSQLAAVVRTGRRRQAHVRFLSRGKPVEAVVTLARVWIRGEPEPMVVAAAGPVPGQAPVPDRPPPQRAEDEAVATVVHRMDVLATASEMLLSEPLFNEQVAIRRCARLLAAELADWVLIDVAPDTASGHAPEAPELRRQVVVGPGGERAAELTHALEELDPLPGTLPHSVFTGRQGALHPHVAELSMLGELPDGSPVCGAISAATVVCVPIEDGQRCLGAITVTGSGEHGPFDLMDLGVLQRLGRYLGLVVRAARLYRHRSQVAASLQNSLLPKALPAIPGVEVDARYLTATRGGEIGGDFYDVFETATGWGFVLGDVCGKGEEAAAVTAAARHGVRLLSRWKTEPAEVLSMVNAALLNEDRFVTAVLAGLEVLDSGIRLTLSTAGHPPAIVVRQDGMIRTTSGGGVPMGLFEDFEPAIESIELAAGDTVFLYSDGVVDACDMKRERFGHERLIETLAAAAGQPVREMLLAVERALMDFCDGDLGDDVSILALRVLPQALN